MPHPASPAQVEAEVPASGGARPAAPADAPAVGEPDADAASGEDAESEEEGEQSSDAEACEDEGGEADARAASRIRAAEDLTMSKQKAWRPCEVAKKARDDAKKLAAEAAGATAAASEAQQLNARRQSEVEKDQAEAEVEPRSAVTPCEVFGSCCRCSLCLDLRDQPLAVGSRVVVAEADVPGARQALRGKQGTVTEVRREDDGRKSKVPYEVRQCLSPRLE